jgi:hypothetical protein
MSDQLARIDLLTGGGERIASAGRHGPLTRLRARLRGASLDRALRDGVDPAASAALAQRAALLTSARRRRALARSYRRLLELPTGRPRPSSAVPPHREELARARLPLARVSALLDETDEPVYSRGVAMAQLLLTEGDGPLYTQARPGELRRRAEEIVNALEGREETWWR